MRLQVLAVLMAAAVAGCLPGQTVVASSDRFLKPASGGEAVFIVQVTIGADRSLGDVITALAPAGILPQDLAGRAVGRLPDGGPALTQFFLFRMVRPASRFAEMQGLMEGIAGANRDITLSFDGRVELRQADIDQARAATLPALFSETKARTEAMLIEAGYRPGAIVELEEWIEPNGGFGFRLSLSLRMARLGAAPNGSARVSTLVTPLRAPYLLSAPQLQATYSVTPPGTRAQLLELLAPAGLAEAQLTGVFAEPSRRNGNGLEPSPVTFTYRFTAPVAEADIASRLQRLAQLEDGGANVAYVVTPPPVDPLVLATAARARAKPLADLLGGKLDSGLGAAVENFSRAPFAIRIGFLRFFSQPSPGEVVLEEPSYPPWFRYRFAVTGGNE